MSKKRYQHVLVAVDLSDRCGKLLARAVEIARLTKATLTLAHVLPNVFIPYAGEFSIPIDTELGEKLKEGAKKRLAAYGKKYKVSNKNQYLLEGSVKIEITKLAKKLRADLIVIGTHDCEGLEMLLGSQASAILHAASCDVWVVRCF